jgi:hypothetical protein
MSDLCRLIWCALIGLFRPRAALEAENLVLRHQLNVLRRKSPKRVALSSIDRLLLVGLYRLAPGVLDALKIIRPETLLRWHRAGFRAFWRWKSRPRGGRPRTPANIRRLIREMSVANPLWALRGSYSNSASMLDRPPWQNTWRGEGSHRRRAGRPFCAISECGLAEVRLAPESDRVADICGRLHHRSSVLRYAMISST